MGPAHAARPADVDLRVPGHADRDRAHGSRFEYRSCETDILGWICERATGTRLPDLLSARIWSRLANGSWLPGGREVLLCLGIHCQMIWVEPARELVVVKLSSRPLPQEPGFLVDAI